MWTEYFEGKPLLKALGKFEFAREAVLGVMTLHVMKFVTILVEPNCHKTLFIFMGAGEGNADNSSSNLILAVIVKLILRCEFRNHEGCVGVQAPI